MNTSVINYNVSIYYNVSQQYLVNFLCKHIKVVYSLAKEFLNTHVFADLGGCVVFNVSLFKQFVSLMISF